VGPLGEEHMLAVSLCTFGYGIPKSAQKYGNFNKKNTSPR